MPESVKVEQEKSLLVWKAKSRPFKPAEAQTKSVLMVLGILVAIVLALASEWMVLMVLGAGAFFYYAWTNVPPEVMEFKITNKGVWAFGRMYMWWEFKCWWLDEKWNTDLLAMQLKSGVLGRLYIPIEGVKLEEVKRIVNKYLIYEKPADTTLDKMGKWMMDKFPLESKA